jgi:hypothetical protein
VSLVRGPLSLGRCALPCSGRPLLCGLVNHCLSV